VYQLKSQIGRQDGLVIELRALGLVLRVLEKRIASGNRGRYGGHWIKEISRRLDKYI
jgi:hypothetical protein